MDFINKIIENIIKIFDKEYDRRKSVQFILVTIVCLAIGILIYSYYSYDSRLAVRIDNLKTLSELDVTKFDNDEIMINEYNRLLLEIKNRSFLERIDFTNVQLISYNSGSDIMKIMTGGGLWFALIILSPFIYKTFGETVKAIFLFMVIGGVFSSIAYIIPTFILPIVNYILFPCFEVLLIYWINKKMQKK